MRLNYYRFPDDAPVAAMVANGCEGICDDGRKVHSQSAGDGCTHTYESARCASGSSGTA